MIARTSDRRGRPPAPDATDETLTRARGERGQSLVEFALVLVPLLVILMGIIQFGFIFNTQVTLTNAVREAAREGSIHRATGTSKQAMDTARNAAIVRVLKSSMNLLHAAPPHFDATGGTTSGNVSSGSTVAYLAGDLRVDYSQGTALMSDGRTGWALTVTATYHQDLFFPFVSVLLPQDAGGRLPQRASATMVIN